MTYFPMRLLESGGRAGILLAKRWINSYSIGHRLMVDFFELS